ncbi:MAG: NAD(P)-binding protein [Bacillota bacterium]
MRVAIVGAGLAGLACAYELERLGILPVIFERQKAVGKPHLVMETMAQFLHHNPRQDIFDYIRNELSLPLNPHNHIQSMVLHSPNQEATIHGHLGYCTVRGHDDRSLERQLAARVAAEIRLGQRPDPWELRREFDWVVVATGDHAWSREFTAWTTDVNWSVRGATVSGFFNPNELHYFFDPRYAKTGYAMIAPIDERMASVGVGVPHASGDEADRYWERFRSEQGRFWEKEIAPIRVDNMAIGRPAANIVGNLVLVGQAGGFAEPLGIAGQCPSLASGVFAARQITLGDRSLVRFARRYRAYYHRVWRIRRNVNAWTAEEMDRLVRAAGYTGGLLATLPFNLFTQAGWALDALRLADDPSPEVGPW